MENVIKLEDAYKLASEKETETELIVTNPETHETIATLTGFADDLRTCACTMNKLCIDASILAEFNRPVFMEYVTNTLKLSRTTAIQMINAGDLYRQDKALFDAEIGYSKVVELSPVKEQLDDFMLTIDENSQLSVEEQIAMKPQKEIRRLVKDFLASGTAQLEQPEQPEESEPVDQDESDDTIEGKYISIDTLATVEGEIATMIECILKAKEKAMIFKDRTDLAPTYKGYINKVLEHLNVIRESVRIIDKQLFDDESEVD